MITYVVVQQGVYIQEVFGPFDLARARNVAQALANSDRDDYHDYNVQELTPQGLSTPVATFKKGH